MAFFSIIIPLYNKEKCLEATLKSVLNQTFTNFEVVIVNDGSTDKSLEIAQTFENEKIKIYSQKNQGVSLARNYGMQQSKAKYFCFLDADDFWKPNHLQSFYEVIQKFSNAGLYCNRFETKTSERKILYNKLDNMDDSFEGIVPNFFKNSLKNRIALTSATCIPSKVFSDIGGFDTAISSGQDLDYWIRIALKYPVVVTKNTTLIYNYTFENKSLSKIKISNKKLMDFSKFNSDEVENKDLKNFLDVYRIEYALHFHIEGFSDKKMFYLKDVSLNNLNIKTKILLKTPPFILRKLLYFKRYIKKFGLDFTVYH